MVTHWVWNTVVINTWRFPLNGPVSSKRFFFFNANTGSARSCEKVRRSFPLCLQDMSHTDVRDEACVKGRQSLSLVHQRLWIQQKPGGETRTFHKDRNPVSEEKESQSFSAGHEKEKNETGREVLLSEKSERMEGRSRTDQSSVTSLRLRRDEKSVITACRNKTIATELLYASCW